MIPPEGSDGRLGVAALQSTRPLTRRSNSILAAIHTTAAFSNNVEVRTQPFRTCLAAAAFGVSACFFGIHVVRPLPLRLYAAWPSTARPQPYRLARHVSSEPESLSLLSSAYQTFRRPAMSSLQQTFSSPGLCSFRGEGRRAEEMIGWIVLNIRSEAVSIEDRFVCVNSQRASHELPETWMSKMRARENPGRIHSWKSEWKIEIRLFLVLPARGASNRTLRFCSESPSPAHHHLANLAGPHVQPTIPRKHARTPVLRQHSSPENTVEVCKALHASDWTSTKFTRTKRRMLKEGQWRTDIFMLYGWCADGLEVLVAALR